MLLNIAEDLAFGTSPEAVWKLLRDTPRFAGLLPGVESVVPLDHGTVDPATEAYSVTVGEKIGPFKIRLKLAVRVVEAVEPSRLKVAIQGSDGLGANRVTGSITVELRAAVSGSQAHFAASIEVLGKLASLGAVSIRRRTTESFAAFARNIQNELAEEPS